MSQLSKLKKAMRKLEKKYDKAGQIEKNRILKQAEALQEKINKLIE